MLHRPLDEALLRREIHDVVLVDPGGQSSSGTSCTSVGLRLVLDQLDELVAIDDLPGVAAMLRPSTNGRGVTWRGLPPLWRTSPTKALMPRSASARRQPGPAQRRGVGQQEVGGCHRVEQQLAAEASLRRRRFLEFRDVEQLHQQITGLQVLLL